jgi:hypothetical protein
MDANELKRVRGQCLQDYPSTAVEPKLKVSIDVGKSAEAERYRAFLEATKKTVSLSLVSNVKSCTS